MGETTEGIRLASLTRTCTACPSQWDAETIDGRKLYIRYRWGVLTVCEYPLENWSNYLYDHQISDGMDGYMTDNDMLEHTGMWLET